jgi:hypothetical protein
VGSRRSCLRGGQRKPYFDTGAVGLEGDIRSDHVPKSMVLLSHDDGRGIRNFGVFRDGQTEGYQLVVTVSVQAKAAAYGFSPSSNNHESILLG